jgi:nucleosome binding factor SPN SPT16 subunit
VLKDACKGKMAEEWSGLVDTMKLNKVDVAEGLAHVMSVKDNEELVCGQALFLTNSF